MVGSKAAWRRWLLRLIGALSLLASASCFWLWYAHYLGLEFNAEGRLHDPEAGVVYTDAAFGWAFPAFGFLLLAWVTWRRSRR